MIELDLELVFVCAACTLLLLVGLVVCRMCFIRPCFTKPARTLVVLGSGGHTAEMLALLEGLDSSKYSPVHYVMATSDKTSLPRLQKDHVERDCGLLKAQVDQHYHTIPRSREVGQSWISTVFTTLRSMISSVYLVVWEVQPDLVLVNGPGTCVPIVLGALVLKLLYKRSVKIVFIESFCRVQSLSMTGKILYLIADRFIVQWPTLCKRYPRAEYLGVVY